MTQRVFARVALALVASLAVAGCSRAPDDRALETSIKARMFSDAQVRSAPVSVAVRNGEATLSGGVPDDATRLAAYKIAAETPGVTKVNDQMTLQTAQAGPAPDQAAPAEAPPPPPQPVKRRLHALQHAPSPPAPHEEAVPAPPSPVQAPPPAASASAVQPPAPPPPPRPRKITLPAGESLQVRMIDGIDSKTAQPGTVYHASVDAPLRVEGEEVVPRGADAYVLLTRAKSAGRIAGSSELQVELAQIVVNGHTYAVSSDTAERQGNSRGKQSAERIGAATAVGAIIGAIAGGGRGAAIGATAGAAGGTGVQVFTHGQQVKIPPETLLVFRLEAPVTVTLPPSASSSD